MIHDIVRLSAKRPIPQDKLCAKLGLTAKELQRVITTANKQGIHVTAKGGYVMTVVPTGPYKTVVLGKPKVGRNHVAHISDEHFGSTHCDENAILEFLHLAWDRGCEYLVKTGDSLDGIGEKLIKDQSYFGFDQQSKRQELIFKKAPPFKGIVEIDGNHNGYISDAAGFVCGEVVAQRMRALGFNWHFAGVCAGRAVVQGATYDLWHPHGGESKRNGLRIKLNDRAEAIVQHAHFTVMGHFHKYATVMSFPERIFGIAMPTFQRKRSEFATRITSNWDVGGVISSFTADKKGNISEQAAEFYPAKGFW